MHDMNCMHNPHEMQGMHNMHAAHVAQQVTDLQAIENAHAAMAARVSALETEAMLILQLQYLRDGCGGFGRHGEAGALQQWRSAPRAQVVGDAARSVQVLCFFACDLSHIGKPPRRTRVEAAVKRL